MSSEPMTNAIAEAIAKKAAEEAVANFAQKLGINMDKLEETQKDLIYLRRLRSTRDEISKKVIGTLTALGITGLVSAILLAFKEYFK